MMALVEEETWCRACIIARDPKIAMSMDLAEMAVIMKQIEEPEDFWEAIGQLGTYVVMYGSILLGVYDERERVEELTKRVAN